jgi:YHS domain-containing protein
MAPMAHDVVCGMDVNEQDAIARGLTSEDQGRTFCFCSPGCKRKFDREPERYVGQQAK